jgi:hypothetical protein
MKGEMFLIGLIVFEVSLEIGNDKFVEKWALKWRDNIERDDTLQNDAHLNDPHHNDRRMTLYSTTVTLTAINRMSLIKMTAE